MSLCVMTPMIGSVNETFVRRHANDLVPGAPVVALHEAPEEQSCWTVKGPKLLLPHVCHGKQCNGPGMPDRDLEAFLRKNHVSVILAEYLHFAVAFVSLARRLGIRFYAHAHGFDCSAILKEEQWSRKYQVLRDADGVIVVSEKMKATLTHSGIAESLIHSIPCGVDIGELPDRQNHERVRFLSVGRLTGKKGPIFVLDAFRRTLERHPESELDMIGDGELAEAVRQFVRAFSLADRVRLHGSQPPRFVQQSIREADVFVQHSVTNTATGDEEGLPVAILEAMAGGLPVVATLHAGIPEAVVDGETGFLVTEGDTVGMGARMSILARDHTLRVDMGAKGFARARDRFAWSRERELLLHAMRIAQD